MFGGLGFAVFLFISVVLYLLVKNKDEIKKVSNRNKLFVAVTFVGLLIVSGLTIYYAGNWLAGFIGNGTLKFFFQIIWMLIVIALLNIIWETVLNRVKRDSGIV
ncbi:hypothetical protein LC048_24440 [Mesobacillus subterraneus]|uniref:hypothetical protein n=1 Tax=Mesobacillus subterraneus TaxID=285983 RepID=UPI00274021A7|nr:hypothetical protein [Mesobacillus subterraneus]WLR55373.1 hypothetical protein LC048_24440 [Mesobacillus subterraneus]